MQNAAADNCTFPLVNSVYCPLHDVSELLDATKMEPSMFSLLVDPKPDGSTPGTLQAGYEYLYEGVGNDYNKLKTYPSYTVTKSETLMCYDEYYGPLKGKTKYAPNDVVKEALKVGGIAEYTGPALTQYFDDTVRTEDHFVNEESAKKITQYTTTLIEMFQLMEKAVQQAKKDGGCFAYTGNKEGGTPCEEAAKFWDQAAAVQDGPNYLGAKRCQNYLTCGFTNDTTDTIAIANTKVLNLFQVGQSAIRTGDIVATKGIIKLIQSAQIVPYIQGVGRYAWKISDATAPTLAANNKYYAEGAAFATGMLPQLHKCNRAAARTVDKTFQLQVGNKWEFEKFETFRSFFDQVRAEYQCL